MLGFLYFALGGELRHFFYYCLLKQNFTYQGRHAVASAAARGSLPPIPARCACSQHDGKRQVRLVGSISRWGLPGAPKRQPIEK